MKLLYSFSGNGILGSKINFIIVQGGTIMVHVSDEIRNLPAYGSPQAEEMPMFAENRVHQRSSGNPYPNRVVLETDRRLPQENPFRIITLENEYLRLELMPELGGRIYSAFDKRTGYDFFYKQHVIKPALIGMLGSWISGGVEFNWPCHHRPSTFMQTDVSVERHPDGAVTVWMSEHEPLDRMKGMVGIHLAPGEARFDTRMKVYNRTPDRHSFLWWENAAVPVHPKYRLVFPPDVKYVQFHYRKNVTTYPVASGVYNGIRMGSGTDISLHGNTRQPTSYFCGKTRYGFFGGYDEEKNCGVIHVADRHVSAGKKMFTWAYNQLSESWERALTDTDGAYAELMAGSYSWNQPDFAWLAAYESREFSQMWYPVGNIGTPLIACRELAVSVHDGALHLAATAPIRDAMLIANGKPIPLAMTPDEPMHVPFSEEISTLELKDRDGACLLQYQQPEPEREPLPATIPDNPTLDQLKSAEECYRIGVHCEQYRDPAARPEGYYAEALRRDPDHPTALTAMARILLSQQKPEKALETAEHAWHVLTVRNFHPESGELQYTLGRIHEALGQDEDALEWYLQAAWASDARSRAMTRAAMIAGRQGRASSMIEYAEKALEYQVHNETATLLHAIGCRKMGREKEAEQILSGLLAFDPLNATGRALQLGATDAFFATLLSDPAQTVLDCCEELADAGETGLAADLLSSLPEKTIMTAYVLAMLKGTAATPSETAKLPIGAAYPSRPIEYRALRQALAQNPKDARAHELLGCLLYGLGNHKEGETCFARAAELAPEAMYLRNLSVALFRDPGKRDRVLPLLDEALLKKPHDPQLVFEKAHVMHRTGTDPNAIVAFLEGEPAEREDIRIEFARALNLSGRYEDALHLLSAHRFTPCEGGEHAVAEQYMFAHYALGRRLLSAGDPEAALDHFRAAQTLPQNLGAGLWNEVLLVPHRYFEARCLQEMNLNTEVEELLRWLLSIKQDYFTDMHLPELPCWQAAAMKQMGRDAEARELLSAHARAQDRAERARDAGYRRTTPFFLSYMEDAATLRRSLCAWQRAMIAWAGGDETGAAQWAGRSLEGEPANLYARLMARGN